MYPKHLAISVYIACFVQISVFVQRNINKLLHKIVELWQCNHCDLLNYMSQNICIACFNAKSQRNKIIEIDVKSDCKMSTISMLQSIGDTLIKCHLMVFLWPYEQFQLCQVCRYFNKLFGASSFNFYQHQSFHNNFWSTHFQQHYSTNFQRLHFRNGSLCRLALFVEKSMLQLLYFIIFNVQFAKNLQCIPLISELDLSRNGKYFGKLGTNIIVNVLKYHFCYKLRDENGEKLHKQRSIDNFELRNTGNGFESITANVNNIDDRNNGLTSIILSGNRLNHKMFRLFGNAILHRTHPLTIEVLSFSYNENIGDKYMKLLFDAIGKNCPNLLSLDLTLTGISDKTCQIIYDYYKMFHKISKLFLICLLKNEKITWTGVDIINDISEHEIMPIQVMDRFEIQVIGAIDISDDDNDNNNNNMITVCDGADTPDTGDTATDDNDNDNDDECDKQ